MASGTNRDTAVGMVGAVVLIAAMGGVFFYERGQFQTYEVSWETAEVVSESASGTLDEGDSAAPNFSVEEERLSTATASLSWSDDAGGADTFRLTVEGPNGTYSDTDEVSSSPLEVEVPIQEAPDTSTATGRSIEDARNQLNDSASWTNGTGDWTVTVTLVDAPGGQLPTEEDGSQDYDVTFTVERWEPSLVPT